VLCEREKSSVILWPQLLKATAFFQFLWNNLANSNSDVGFEMELNDPKYSCHELGLHFNHASKLLKIVCKGELFTIERLQSFILISCRLLMEKCTPLCVTFHLRSVFSQNSMWGARRVLPEWLEETLFCCFPRARATRLLLAGGSLVGSPLFDLPVVDPGHGDLGGCDLVAEEV